MKVAYKGCQVDVTPHEVNGTFAAHATIVRYMSEDDPDTGYDEFASGDLQTFVTRVEAEDHALTWAIAWIDENWM